MFVCSLQGSYAEIKKTTYVEDGSKDPNYHD